MLSIRGVAIIIELIASPLIALGVFTRMAAFFCAAEMVGAYWVVHRPLGPLPIGNRGELAALYFCVFVYMCLRGGGPLSLDRVLRSRP